MSNTGQPIYVALLNCKRLRKNWEQSRRLGSGKITVQPKKWKL